MTTDSIATADSVPITSAQRLAALKAKRSQLKEQQDALNAEHAEAAELAKEELGLANDTALMAAAAKYGPIGEKWDALLTRLGVVIVRRATDSHFKEYQENPVFKFEGTEAFVRRCIEYPALPAFDAIYLELPGIIVDLSILINKLMGIQAGERVKK